MSQFNLDAPVFIPRFGGAPTSPQPPAPTPVQQPPAPVPAPVQQPQPPPIQQSAPPQQQQQQQQPSNDNNNKEVINQAPPPQLQQQQSNESKPVKEAAAAVAKTVESTTNNAAVEEIAANKLKNLDLDDENEETDENWDNTNDNGEGAAAGDDAAKPKPKKQLVIREYKAKKEPVNVIFCGHVDAGKSTIGGQIMFLTGMVDKRTLEKYERDAKEMNRESWYLSWALDTNDEEREKGKTVEVGRAYFETEKKHFTILDAPGHKGFVPNMIGGASQADIAVLVISARRGEFETGFERGGQTREHAMLVKTAGIKYLIVLVNKMDDPTVLWDETRYEEIKDKLTPYLKKCGFQIGKDVYFMPCSGFTGAFIKDVPEESVCSWYRGPCFIPYLDDLPTMNRTSSGPLRMPIMDKYKEMGTIVLGKIESGMIRLSDKLVLMPNKVKVEVSNIYCEDDETDSAICGENVKIKLRGIEDTDVSSGFVLCDPRDLCMVAKVFDAQVIILECSSIISPGFNSIMHIHTATVEVQFKAIIGLVDRKTGEKDLKSHPRFIKQDQIAICRFDVLGGNVCCMELFKITPQLGRFTLRHESKTVAVGKVLKIVE